ncbi:serine/threonine-protein kinase [Stackebrandtia albiflava]|uniref:non-specific serine/threonine protein kinase n=1 Tax=Stackebrandtia albiflava TaxID=406432 RepID=A0A562UL25_9ACTN|nr:serine/threonine-protein kinase [Stackebrandtia albiflava]TWJ06310.1 serine/threonine-protein kinase [Stackebrandtia albiflava]
MRVGQLLGGRYRLDDRVDSGGMGTVWRGTDTRLNRTVAVKVLHAGLSNDEMFRRRFEVEARAVAALAAPGIVNIYDYGEDSTPEGSLCYLIMEFVEGRSLSSLLSELGRIDQTELLRILAEAAEALHSAHQAGIIHRDVKPANILITRRGGKPKIVDFGIARANGEAGLTSTGMIMGTTAYVSPEQLHGQPLTGASDVYSLGIVAYECLSGRKPFTGDTPAAIIAGHIGHQPPPLPNDVPPPVADLVMRALAKNPADRFPSAEAFAQACRDAAQGRGPSHTRTMVAPIAPASATRMMPQSPPQHTSPRGVARPMAPPPPPRHDTGVHAARPADTEEGRRGGKLGAVAAVAVGVVAVMVALLILQPWNPDTPEEADADPGSGTSTSSSESSPESSPDGAEDDTQDSGSGGDQSGNDQDPSPSPDPTPIRVPDVLEESAADAEAELREEGFTNIRPEPRGTGQFECGVVEQRPAPDTEVPADSEIVIVVEMAADEESCSEVP